MNEPEANQSMEKKCPQCGATLPSGALEGLCPACLLKQGAAETATQPEAAPFQAPRVEEVARLFPQLEILAFIGKGGMGAVYKARQPALDRFVALKILPPQAGGDPSFAERFNREARALARLNHPNIVAVHDFGQVNGLPFFIMEFVDGLNLRQLERAGKLSPREALQIVPQICEALQFAHDEGIVHRDIKPENILLDKKGRVKIADFGIAKIIGRGPDASMNETKGAIGTPHYMAPEQVEKPESVDHRADIFALGVVFYEMLTGELPLGKFAPPSSRMSRTEVDVRLDEVVLRALEKEPERRYQHASQVKTAVETIASTAAPPNAEALAREILARDYVLDIGSCLQRAWALVKSDFWPIVGITALMVLLIQAAWSTAIGLVAGGPLIGGLSLYYLKRIRGQPATLETCFSGFSSAFLQLALGGAITGVLTFLGFLCFLLPGIFLAVIWWFTLTLVIDKRLDFWPAMELSRKVVIKHFWKFLGFWLLSILMYVAGFALCFIGFLITAPIAMIAATYAYEDIFGAAGSAASQTSARAGPSGTVVLPGATATSPYSGGQGGKPVAAGLAAVMLVVVLILVVALYAGVRRHQLRVSRQAVAAEAAARAASAQSVEPIATVSGPMYGPVIERVIEFTNSNQRALNLASGDYVMPTPSHRLDFGPGGTGTLRTAGVDLYLNDNALEALSTTNSYGYVPGLTALDWRMLGNYVNDDTSEGSDLTSARYSILERLREPRPGFWSTNEATINGTNLVTFITRGGTVGVLQIVGLRENLSGVKIRYKLVEQTPISEPVSAEETTISIQTLADRLDAASTISTSREKDKALALVARDAANAGEVDLVRRTLQRIGSNRTRDQAAHESARLLARRGFRKQAIEIAKTISANLTRYQALAELAQ